MKVVGSDTIRYVMGLAEHSTATGWRALYVYLGSEKLVEYRYANATRFFHNDHLGTTKAVTDHTGLVLERWDHYPTAAHRFYMGWRRELPAGRRRYTGHLRDQETGNDYAGARYYANARGRWLSVDPVRGNMANPQRLNRYAYVLNDPVNYVDPDGAIPLFRGLINWLFRGRPPVPPHPWLDPEIRLPEMVAIEIPSFDDAPVLDWHDALNDLLRGSLLSFLANGITDPCRDLLTKSSRDPAAVAGGIRYYEASKNAIFGRLSVHSVAPGVKYVSYGGEWKSSLEVTLTQLLGSANAAVVMGTDANREVPVWSSVVLVSTWFVENSMPIRTLFREFLHVFFRQGDVALAQTLTGQRFSDPDAASKAISRYIDEHCIREGW
jgi:RHS repeat-associated protein